MFNRVLNIFFLGILFPCLILADELYFMPKDRGVAFKSLLRTLKDSKNTLDIAIYSFTNREISKAIRDVAKRGVLVRIIYDEKSNQNPNQSTIGYLAKLKNIQTCLLEGEISSNKKYRGLMHIKMAISDDRSLILGSANWSKSAFETNYETLLILNNKDFIQKSQDSFNTMFKKCKKY